MDDGLQLEKDYHFILGRILSRLEDLPFDASWWSSRVGLTFRDVAGISYESLSKIRDRLIGTGLVESAVMDVSIKDEYVERTLGFDPKEVGISDELVFPMMVRVSEYFENEAPKIMEKWESELFQARMESNQKTPITFSADGFSRDDGASTLTYPIEQDSKRYWIIKLLNASGAGLTRPKIFTGLPVKVRGTSVEQVSKDIRDINAIFKKRLHLKKNVIINTSGNRGYKINREDYVFVNPKK